jgi:acyl dehydratase
MRSRLDSVAAVMAAVGRDLGATEWLTMTQARIDTFAEATEDRQWIHVDPERAAGGPFGACVAHGFLTLSLANFFLPQLMGYGRLKAGLNIGCDRVRFLAPVRVGARVRGHGEVISAEPAKGDGVQVVVRITVEIEGSDKPGCVVDTISRLYFE